MRQSFKSYLIHQLLSEYIINIMKMNLKLKIKRKLKMQILVLKFMINQSHLHLI